MSEAILNPGEDVDDIKSQQAKILSEISKALAESIIIIARLGFPLDKITDPEVLRSAASISSERVLGLVNKATVNIIEKVEIKEIIDE